MTREEILAAIAKTNETLGRVPTIEELTSATNVTRRGIRKNFSGYTEALHACGLERQGSGYRATVERLFPDWASVVRKLGKIPTMSEYDRCAQYSCRPLIRHYGGWPHVPTGLLAYARNAGLDEEWKDVLDVVASHLQGPQGRAETPGMPSAMRSWPRILGDEPIYGEPLMHPPLSHGPTNESGVVFLFGTVAWELGFIVQRIQTGFPDCEAMRQIEPGRWQRVRIEFEYESRNFLAHLHPTAKCDLIVCWSHNWQECPLEVLELKTVVRRSLAANQHG